MVLAPLETMTISLKKSTLHSYFASPYLESEMNPSDEFILNWIFFNFN